MNILRLLLTTIFFCCFSQIQSQETITHQNYNRVFKKAQQDINNGDFTAATEKHYALIDFLNTNKEAVKDTVNNWLTKNYYSLCRLYLFQEDELSLNL